MIRDISIAVLVLIVAFCIALIMIELFDLIATWLSYPRCLKVLDKGLLGYKI
jgi:hypothetical protein